MLRNAESRATTQAETNRPQVSKATSRRCTTAATTTSLRWLLPTTCQEAKPATTEPRVGSISSLKPACTVPQECTAATNQSASTTTTAIQSRNTERLPRTWTSLAACGLTCTDQWAPFRHTFKDTAWHHNTAWTSNGWDSLHYPKQWHTR